MTLAWAASIKSYSLPWQIISNTYCLIHAAPHGVILLTFAESDTSLLKGVKPCCRFLHFMHWQRNAVTGCAQNSLPCSNATPDWRPAFATTSERKKQRSIALNRRSFEAPLRMEIAAMSAQLSVSLLKQLLHGRRVTEEGRDSHLRGSQPLKACAIRVVYAFIRFMLGGWSGRSASACDFRGGRVRAFA